MARAIFQNGSRKNKPFLAINCAAIPEALLEANFLDMLDSVPQCPEYQVTVKKSKWIRAEKKGFLEFHVKALQWTGNWPQAGVG